MPSAQIQSASFVQPLIDQDFDLAAEVVAETREGATWFKLLEYTPFLTQIAQRLLADVDPQTLIARFLVLDDRLRNVGLGTELFVAVPSDPSMPFKFTAIGLRWCVQSLGYAAPDTQYGAYRSIVSLDELPPGFTWASRSACKEQWFDFHANHNYDKLPQAVQTQCDQLIDALEMDWISGASAKVFVCSIHTPEGKSVDVDIGQLLMSLAPYHRAHAMRSITLYQCSDLVETKLRGELAWLAAMPDRLQLSCAMYAPSALRMARLRSFQQGRHLDSGTEPALDRSSANPRQRM